MNPKIIESFVVLELNKLNIHSEQLNLLKDLSSSKKINLYMYLPAIYAESFKYENDQIVKQLCFSSYLYYLSVIFLDKTIDEQITDKFTRNNYILLAQTLQSYSIQYLQKIFTSESEFWSFLNLRNKEWAQSVYSEMDKDFVYSIANYTKHVVSKVCIGKLSIDAIYVLDKQQNTGLHSRLIDLYEMFYMSYQILDDIDDFDEDFSIGQINIAVGKTKDLISSQDHKIIEKKAVKATFFLYVFEEIISYAIENIQECISNLEKENLPFILLRAKKLESDLLLKKEVCNEFIKESTAEKPLLVGIIDSSLNQNLLASLTYLIDNWQSGFNRLKHKMYFSPKLGFSSSPLQIGDVFQRAIIVTHFQKIIRNTGLKELDKIVQHELEFLKNSKNSNSGWKYFPDLVELPCDSDDLAQVIQAFTKEESDNFSTLFKDPVLRLLKFSNKSLFKTWIYSISNDDIERKNVESKWGDTYDIDVIANIGYALFDNIDDMNFLNKNKVLEILMENALYIVQNQDEEGFWNSVWYDDIYYGTYVSVRYLTCFDVFNDSIDKAIDFFRNSQNDNGSWGGSNKQKLMSTALVLLTLFETKNDLNLKGAISRAAKFILDNRNIDGSYGSDNFIKMEVGRMNKISSKTIYYGSDVLCTSYCLTALSYVYGKNT